MWSFFGYYLLGHKIDISGYMNTSIMNKDMSDSLVTRIKKWIKEVMGGMGGAVVSEKSKTVPPDIGDQPYKDKPKKGVL